MDYMQPADAFLAWFRSVPGTTFHADIRLADLRARGAGRGIVATRDIPADTVLFTIPRSAILCAETSRLSQAIPGLRVDNAAADEDEDEDDEDDDDDDDDTKQDPWTSLILVLMHEFLRGPASAWQPYLDVLPRTFDTPMFWSADDVAQLQASPVVQRIGRADADAMIRRKVLPVVRAHPTAFFADSTNASMTDDELVALAHRMGSTIMAYSFSLEKDEDEDGVGGGKSSKRSNDDHAPSMDGSEDVEMTDPDEPHDADDDASSSSDDDGWVEDRDDEQPLGMVPMADMLNADAEPNAHIHHGTDALSATSIRPIRAGEEILNYYGPLSNGELLRRYGYTTTKHAHFDAVDVPWALVEHALAAQLPLLSATDAAKITHMLADGAQDADDDDDAEWDDPVMLDRDFDADAATGRLSSPTSGRVLHELPPQLRAQSRAWLRLAHKRIAKKMDREKARIKDEPVPPVPPVTKKGKYGKYGKGKAAAAPAPAPASDKVRPDAEIVAAALLAALEARLAQYPTTADADADELAQLDATPLATRSPADHRRAAALRVRIGEKRLLADAVDLARTALAAETGTGTGTGTGKRHKRLGSRAMDMDEPLVKRHKARD